MSTQKRKNDTEEKNIRKQKTDLVTCQNEPTIQNDQTCTNDPTKSETLRLCSPSTGSKENSDDCFADINDDQGNYIGYLLIGEHENQVSEFGAEDLPNLKKKCTKNPGHPEFIPIESFSLNHLPEGHRDSDLYELIKAAADLTVRIDVAMTSPERPDFWPDTKIPYFLSSMRGRKTLRTGSGMLSEIRKHPEDYNEEDCVACPCDTCEASDKPSKNWWTLALNTATHVVFDDIEASHTALKLFYDKEDSEVVILKDKVCVEIGSISEDWCRINCVTCDERLGKKLEEMVKRYQGIWVKIQDKYKLSRDTHKLNFVVSHPHGCTKQISVGQWKEKIQDEDGYNKFTYTTCTCPGSSGASVHCVGYTGWSDYAHSGSLKSGINVSGANYYFPRENEDSDTP